MVRYIVRRVLYAIPILLGVSLLTFIMFFMTATPDQMARHNLSAKNPTVKQIQEWEHQHGYDKRMSVQFQQYMTALFKFQLGKADSNGEDIRERVLKSGPVSLKLASITFILSLFVTLTAALVVAYFRGTYLDVWSTFLCVLLMSVVYLVYIIAGQYLLGKVLKIFPLAGYHGGIESWKYVLLPAIVGLVSGLGSGVRLYRTFFLDEINQDYVRTARAKGVREGAILFRHVLKNAAIPVLTTTASAIPALFLGSIIGESFFNIPGLGTYLVDAINSYDFAVVRAMVFIGAITTILGYLLTDISYTYADPRVRLE